MPRDDYTEQMRAAVEREMARTAAEGNCIARIPNGDLCRRRVGKKRLEQGLSTCRLHAPVLNRRQAEPTSN